jgi:hypothetical protein
VTARESRLRRALEVVAMIPQAYHDRGPAVVVAEMESAVRQALEDDVRAVITRRDAQRGRRA